MFIGVMKGWFQIDPIRVGYERNPIFNWVILYFNITINFWKFG